MDIPMRKPEPAIEFCEFVDQLEEKYGFNYRDMAGKYSKESREEQNALRDKWLEDNGYANKAYVLNKPEGSKDDWPKDSEEMRLRIEIHNKSWKHLNDEFDKMRPYQDVWHWLLDNDFMDFRRGGINYLSLVRDDDEELPDYVKKFLDVVLEEVKDNEAFDGECLACYIDW